MYTFCYIWRKFNWSEHEAEVTPTGGVVSDWLHRHSTGNLGTQPLGSPGGIPSYRQFREYRFLNISAQLELHPDNLTCPHVLCVSTENLMVLKANNFWVRSTSSSIRIFKTKLVTKNLSVIRCVALLPVIGYYRSSITALDFLVT